MPKTINRHIIDNTIMIIQDLYLQDDIPWIVGYSGGKDSTAIVQLIWNALKLLPDDKKKKKNVYVISTDTLVESPVIASWANLSLDRMKLQEQIDKIGIIPKRLTPQVKNSFWVNLIGKGYPYPKTSFRWCTDRLKIEPSNRFIKNIVSDGSEAILVLGTRKAESESRRNVMESYEKKRYREFLSPNGSLPNSYIFSPIENWSDDNVWQYLMMDANPWGHSNKELLSLYSGASEDGECPLVIDTSTPSCGNSRFGCWVCTVVPEDKSMAAMIRNNEDKLWMYPMLKFRNYIAADSGTDRSRRDFRRINGALTYQNGHLVHGPYMKSAREDFLRKLLELQKSLRANKNAPDEVRHIELITHEELKCIRQIWLDEKHEFDDAVPRIYCEVTGQHFSDENLKRNVFYGKTEWDLLSDICKTEYPEDRVLLNMQSALLDIEAKSSMQLRRHNILDMLEEEIIKASYKDENDALQREIERRVRVGVLTNDEIEQASAQERI